MPKNALKMRSWLFAPGDEAIARHYAEFIGDGADLQTRIGAVPGAKLSL